MMNFAPPLSGEKGGSNEIVESVVHDTDFRLLCLLGGEVFSTSREEKAMPGVRLAENSNVQRIQKGENVKAEKEFIQQERERIAFEERLDMGLRVWLNTVPPDRVLSALEPPILPPPTLAGREPRVGSSANPGMQTMSAWAKAMSQTSSSTEASAAKLISDPEDTIVKVVLANGREIPIPESVLRYVIKELWRAGYAIM